MLCSILAFGELLLRKLLLRKLLLGHELTLELLQPCFHAIAEARLGLSCVRHVRLHLLVLLLHELILLLHLLKLRLALGFLLLRRGNACTVLHHKHFLKRDEREVPTWVCKLKIAPAIIGELGFQFIWLDFHCVYAAAVECDSCLNFHGVLLAALEWGELSQLIISPGAGEFLEIYAGTQLETFCGNEPIGMLGGLVYVVPRCGCFHHATVRMVRVDLP